MAEDYLVYIENEYYTIKIFKRKEGYYPCSYNILTAQNHTISESSQGKILLRLVRAFQLYDENFSNKEMKMIQNDILVIVRKLNISEYYLEKISRGRGVEDMSHTNWKKPAKSLRQKYHTDYDEKSVFSSNARLLQSVWREDHLQLKDMGRQSDKGNYYGNFLPLEKAKQEGLNFLNKKYFNVVKEAIEKKEAGALIKEPRIWDNMLSSQPMSFNLFAELKNNKTLATKLFSTMFPDRVSKVTDMKFEHSPGRGNAKYTSDKSAFDVFFTYKSTENKNGFIGIEVKYAEDMDDPLAEYKKRYEEIMSESGLFNQELLPKLKGKPIQQIWRDHLLALSMYKINQDYDEGMFMFLYPEKNSECAAAAAKYKDTFLEDDEEKNGFYPRTLEEVVAILKDNSTDQWIEEFYDRYLNFSKINELESSI